MEDAQRRIITGELAKTLMRFKRLGGPPVSFNGIKRSEFFLLANLADYSSSNSEGIKISDLSTQMDVTPPAVTHIINSLEEIGLVERLPDSNDRRVVLIRPTKKGEQIVEKIKGEFLDNLMGLVEFLGEKDSKEFIRLLSLTVDYHNEKRRQKGND